MKTAIPQLEIIELCINQIKHLCYIPVLLTLSFLANLFVHKVAINFCSFVCSVFICLRMYFFILFTLFNILSFFLKVKPRAEVAGASLKLWADVFLV